MFGITFLLYQACYHKWQLCILLLPVPDSPPYPPGSFDRVLLDAPCSALGQRPQALCHFKLKELLSYPPYQRMLIKQVYSSHSECIQHGYSQCMPLLNFPGNLQAVGLLKSGGTLVYSTCTYSPEENECQVEWMLRTFPQIQLVKQVCPCHVLMVVSLITGPNPDMQNCNTNYV